MPTLEFAQEHGRCRRRIRSPLQHSNAERCAMSDSDGMRQTGGVFRTGRFDGFVECIGQEVVAGFRLDGNEPVHMFGFEVTLQLSCINVLGAIDD